MNEPGNNKVGNNNSGQLLKGIAEGNIQGLKIPKDAIIEGKKIKNSALKIFIETSRSTGKIDDKTLLDILILFDGAIEQGILDNELLEAIKNKPELLESLFKIKKQ